jgi:hypothetical protein
VVDAQPDGPSVRDIDVWFPRTSLAFFPPAGDHASSLLDCGGETLWERIRCIAQPNNLVGAAFSQDGTRIAMFYSDGRILVHAIAFDDVLETAKGHVTRSLTDAECRTYLHVPTCPTD